MARRPRLRVVGAAGSALLLGAGLLFVSAVAGHSSRASADPTGASPGVYEAAAGNVDTLPLSTIQAGTTVTGASSTATYGPVEVNVKATKALVGSTGAAGPEIGAIGVQGNARSADASLASKAIAIAMDPDPQEPDLAFVLEANANSDLGAVVQQVDMSASPPAAPVVTTLAAGLQVSDPTSIAISPDGGTLFVGGTVGDGFFGIEAIQVRNPAQGTMWSAQSNASVPFSPGHVVSLALSPDGLFLYGAAVPAAVGGNAAVFALGLPLSPGEKVKWLATTAFTPTALTVSPLGDTVYAGGSAPSGQSTVQAFAASTGSAGAQSKPITMGLSSIAITPDGDTLLATGTDDTTPTAPVVAYPLSLPNLSIGARTTFRNLSSPATASPTIAITPDQAPAARIVASTTVEEGQALAFDASTSTVAYGAISNFAWTFGDGQTGSGVTVTHTYSAAGTFSVVLTETDRAGTGLTTGVPGVSGPVAGPGQTPFRLASQSARTTVQISVTTPPTTPPTTPTPPTPPSTLPPTPSTVPPTVPPAAVPTLTLNPGVGPPGTIVTVTGSGFRPNTPVTVAWSTSTGSVVVVADALGDLAPTPLDILTPDVLGPRYAVASSTPPASAPFLVVPSDSEPGGGSGDFLFRSEGP